MLPLSFVCLRASANLPGWLSDAVSGSPAEAVLYRAMQLPGVRVLFPRPPAESIDELNKLIASNPRPELLSLRARQNEAALRFREAEADWKSYAAQSGDKAVGLRALADFYGRRVQAQPQFETLLTLGDLPVVASDKLLAPDAQPGWKAFEEALRVANQQLLDPTTVEALWQRWMARYPDQPSVPSRAVEWEIAHGRLPQAEAIVAGYRQRFPAETTLPLRATALIALRPVNGTTDLAGVNRALAVYGAAFRPDWPDTLVKSYMQLLAATHNQRRFTAEARARLERDPDDLNAAARLFFYQQQAGQSQAALGALEDYRAGREARLAGGTKAAKPWSPDELHMLAALAVRAGGYPEAARFDFALASLPGALPDGQAAHAAGLAGLAEMLLTAPEQPIALGSGNLSLYRDIAQVDQGPGFWNGVLSLWLNGSQPATEFDSEETKAGPYFHRAKAAALVALLDRDAPGAPQRAALHAKLVDVYADYGDDTAVLREGEAYLNAFAQGKDRTAVSLQMATALERTKKPADEFALYDRLLKELAAKTDHLPLTAAGLERQRAAAASDAASTSASAAYAAPEAATGTGASSDAGTDAGASTDVPVDSSSTPQLSDGAPNSPKSLSTGAFSLDAGRPQPAANPAAAEYAQVLDRYLGRLTAEKKLPEALAVLRRELDRNPDDPALYERLSAFLEANSLAAQDEDVYKRAIDHFGGTGWYDKLARFYLRQKRSSDFGSLTRRVVDTFAGTELAGYFGQVSSLGGPGSGALTVQLNLYAHKRFPHAPLFTQNLLRLYAAKGTADPVAREQLLRETWWQTPETAAQFFELLSSKGALDAELAKLGPATADEATGNPAAADERAQAEIWRSEFEQAAPAMTALAAAYPADKTIGTTAADLNRSLAWYDPATAPGTPTAHTAAAVAVEERLVAADPTDTGLLEKVGDTLADHVSGDPATFAAAAKVWRREPGLAPGDPQHYLNAATVFWDYFQFSEAEAILNEARKRLAQPSLYAYEMGALAEGRRDDLAAVREYVRAVVDPAPGEWDQSGESTVRLMQLAGRPAFAKLVDATTLEAVNASNGGSPKLYLALHGGQSTDAGSDPASGKADAALSAALQLRVSVLQAQNRQSEIGPLLVTAARGAQTLDGAAAIASFAQAQSQVPAREAALIREAELAQDPVERLELRYDLAASMTERKDTAGAAAIMDAIDRENPNLLGVVRRTVDFDYTHDRKPAAVKRLLAAAEVARKPQPALAKQFAAEAAGKANSAGDTNEGRRIALTLLADDPYNAQYLGLAADSYARANDSGGLRQFYLDRLKTVQTAEMTAAERRDRTALLRRGYIPALTQAKDYQEAVAQYTALLSAFPEDAALNNEAALYALRYGRQAQWLAFLDKTTADSPRDARFFIDLAQSQQVFGDGAAAIEAYGKATAIRRDRVDLYQAKAGLEESLGRFDEAAADFARLYPLSYKDPQYMVAMARVRARQGRTADAVAALKTAYLSGPKPVAHDFFTVAAQLEAWNLLDDAGRFATQGRGVAGADFMTGEGLGSTGADLTDDADEGTQKAVTSDPQNDDDVATYARILTRLGRAGEVLAALRKGAADAASVGANSPAMVVAQADAQGPGATTDADWRKARVAARKAAADAAYTRGLAAMGAAIHRYATPEGKTAYVAALTAERAQASPADVQTRWIDAAHDAGLAQLEAEWRRAILTGAATKLAQAQVDPLIRLERQREAFAELGAALEAGLRAHPRLGQNAAAAATEAYRAAGDDAAELRAFKRVPLADGSQASLRERYLELLLNADPAGLVALAGNKSDTLADAATNQAFADQPDGSKPSLPLIRQVIAKRGAKEDAAWRNSYLAEAGLYLGDTSPQTAAAFHDALLPERTIGDRLGDKPAPGVVLTGDAWFYDAARYGQWLLLTPGSRAAAEDVLAAGLEGRANIDDWETLAITYAEAGDTAAALAEIDHELEAVAQPDASVYDVKATVLWNAGRRAEAVAVWRSAFAALRQQEDAGAPSSSFWTEFGQLAARVRERGLYAELKPAMDDVLRPYVHRNDTYRSNELLHAAFDAAPSAAEGTTWILSLSGAAKEPVAVLQDLDHAAWLPASAQVQLLEREIALGPSRGFPAPPLMTRLILLEVREGRNAEAQALLDRLQLADRRTDDLQRAEAVLAGRLGTVPALVARYTADPDHAPSKKVIAAAAGQLSRETRPQPARALLEWSFSNALAAHTLVATDYLALAEARIHANDVPGAVALLRSLTQSGADADTNLDSAAAVLESNHLPAEAVPFLTALVHNVPWDGGAKLRLARAELAAQTREADPAGLLRGLVHDATVSYALRAEAAIELGRLHAADATPKQTALAGPSARIATPKMIEASWQAARPSPAPHMPAKRPTPATGSAVPVPGRSSAELDLLASGSVTAAAARKPFFVAARREAAAHAADEAVTVSLLSEAVAIDPNVAGSAALRLDLLRAQLKAKQFAPALATARLMAPGSGYYGSASEPATAEEDPTASPADGAATGGDTSSGGNGSNDTLNTPGGAEVTRKTLRHVDMTDEDPAVASEEAQRLPAAALALPRAARAALARDLAQVYARGSDSKTALADLKLALRLEPSGPHAAEDRRAIETIERRDALDTANRARRPLVGKGHGGNGVVRLRATAPTEFTTAIDDTEAE